jgi:hypothetical protein
MCTTEKPLQLFTLRSMEQPAKRQAQTDAAQYAMMRAGKHGGTL